MACSQDLGTAVNTTRTGIKLGVHVHTWRHVVDVTEGSGPEIAGLNKQHFQAWRKDSEFLCEALDGSYLEDNKPSNFLQQKVP